MPTPVGLPFRITRNKANEIFSKDHKLFGVNEGANISRDPSSLIVSKSDPVKECMIPFHSAGVRSLTSEYKGKYGVIRSITIPIPVFKKSIFSDEEFMDIEEVDVPYTEWHECSGTLPCIDYPFGTLKTQIYAGFEYPGSIIERVMQCQDVVNIVPITTEMLNFDGSKKTVFPHEMNMEYAVEKLQSRLYDMELERANKYVKRYYGADRIDINITVRSDMAKIKFISYYIAAYIYESFVNDIANYKIINAYSGYLYGNTVYSIIKSSLFGAGVGGLMTFGLTTIMKPYLLVPQILFRVGTGIATSGILSGTIANILNIYRDYDFVCDRENEKKKNSKYIESDEDKKRKKLVEKLNQETDCVKRNGIYISADKCKLLGLDPNTEFTNDMIRQAYHIKIKQWHPDHYKGSTEIATAMTKQLNIAYAELMQHNKN